MRAYIPPAPDGSLPLLAVLGLTTPASAPVSGDWPRLRALQHAGASERGMRLAIQLASGFVAIVLSVHSVNAILLGGWIIALLGSL